MTTYNETIHYLYSLQGRGMKFGLRNIRELLRAAGNPEKRFKSVHIAGTNGKGSTSAFIASIAMEAGLKTGLYTSPHLFRMNERIRVDGTELSDAELVYYVKAMRRKFESVGATFFEATTCIAFRYFADAHVRLAVIETGLGGRLDSTNVLRPLISIITSIGLDHTELLGTTLEAIAYEKGGIIKSRVPVVLGDLDDRARKTLKSIARRRQSAIAGVEKVRCTVQRGDREGWGRFSGIGLKAFSIHPGLPGRYQFKNARVAVLACTILQRMRLGGLWTSEVMARGLTNVRRNTGMRGRFEQVVRPEGTYLFDVAHNPAGTATLVRALKAEGLHPRNVVFGAMRDKDIRGMLKQLKSASRTLVAASPSLDRAMPASGLKALAGSLGFHAVLGRTVASALRRARQMAGKGLVVVTGSHYTVAEGLQALRGDQS